MYPTDVAYGPRHHEMVLNICITIIVVSRTPTYSCVPRCITWDPVFSGHDGSLIKMEAIVGNLWSAERKTNLACLLDFIGGIVSKRAV